MTQSPTITLEFSGLFLFAFGKENQFCQAAIMEGDRHCLKVKIETIAKNSESSSEMEFEIPEGDVIFELPGRDPGVGIYKTGAFDRAASPDKLDFRWVLDLEGRELHDRKLYLKPGALKRSVLISNGVFYNYENRPVRITKPSLPGTSTQTRNVEITQKIGCAVYLGEDEEAVFRYGPNSSFSIKLKSSSEVRYQISLDNICPEEQGDEPTGEGDFARYYDVVDVSPDEQFKVESAAPPPPGTARVPCDPVCMSISEAPLG